MTTPSDPFEELDRELREAVAGEFRRTAEEDEYAARKSALRGRSLPQVAYEMLSRGDTVRVLIGATSMRGVISHARGTLATLTGGDGSEMHVNLAGPIVLEVVERSQSGGRARENYGPESFLARLRELELGESQIEVLTGTDHRPAGRIEAVGADHIMLVGETDQFVPLVWIGAVRRST
ncbi:MAG: hypothetical protein HKN91_01395 [Acidimicrobiia bacterium]|nr:hypothetical protein [Acidimicrobiia bacterium]